MTKKIKLEPVEKTETLTEPEQTEREILIPETLTNKEAQYILDEFYNLLMIYISSNQLSSDDIPKDSKYYLNQILILLEKTGIIVI